MNITQKNNIKKSVVNFFGGLGYFFVALQWMLLFVIYLQPISFFLKSVTPPNNQPAPPPVPVDVVASGPDLPTMIFGIIVTVLMVMLTVYVLIKTPSVIARTGKKAVKTVADTAAPMVMKVQHQPPTARRRNKLTVIIVLIVKILIVIIPVALSLLSQYFDIQTLDFIVVIFASVTLAMIAVLGFVLQYSLSVLFGIKSQDIW